MNTHEHLSIETLADYAEGLLGDAESTAVADHLASCADCTAEADLLVSVSTILAADDPGPMPEQYAARIDAALADLAAAEPVTPKRVGTTPPGKGAEGAAVIDLASRRRFAPAARVTSVAASLVLLIGGVAIGMQALDNTDAGNPGDDLGALDNPSAEPTNSARYLAYALSAKEKPKGKNAERRKDGSVADKRTGAVFLKSGKVLFPDGVVVVPKKDGQTEVRTFDVQSGKSRKIATFRADDPRPTVTAPAPETPQAAENTPQATPEPTPQAPAARPSNGPNKASTMAAQSAQSDPYVTNSGDTYNPDNFAAKVQALLRNAGYTAEGAPAGSASNSTDQGRAASKAVRSDSQSDAAVPARGPAPAELQAKVKRCATQLKLGEVLAGDAGVWRGQNATVIVARNGSEAKQAVGYVVYGECTSAAPATAADVQWEMRVDFPSAQAEPAPTTSDGNSGSNQSPSNSNSNTNSNTNTVTPSVKTSTAPSVSTSTVTPGVTSSVGNTLTNGLATSTEP
ncbi:hypothetical protein GCM10009547_24290 [Sporichthya brevicatena]|uniref:Zinc-finger domain-containing protein n=1 Tax=Sporichthya brevicatena TaxID=171442 RepID=A0ABP3RYH4_9ACTN